MRTGKHNCNVYSILYSEPTKWKPIFSLDNYCEKHEHLRNNFRFFIVRFKVILELEMFTEYLYRPFLNAVKCSQLSGDFWVIYNPLKCVRVFVVCIWFYVNKIDLPQQKYSRIWITRLKPVLNFFFFNYTLINISWI